MSPFGNIPAIVNVVGNTVAIQRENPVANTVGAQDRLVWSTVTASIRASIQPARPSTIEDYQQRNVQVTHSIYFYIDPSLQVGDRISYAGRYFLYEGVRNTVELGRLWRADCREIH